MTTTAVNNTLVQPLTCMAGGQATNPAVIMALQTLDCQLISPMDALGTQVEIK